jgi:hypothetical protein
MTHVIHQSPTVSWWLEAVPGAGWRYVIAGTNWARRSGLFTTAYTAQRAALAIFAEARQ